MAITRRKCAVKKKNDKLDDKNKENDEPVTKKRVGRPPKESNNQTSDEDQGIATVKVIADSETPESFNNDKLNTIKEAKEKDKFYSNDKSVDKSEDSDEGGMPDYQPKKSKLKHTANKGIKQSINFLL